MCLVLPVSQILIFTMPSSDDTDELSKLKAEAVPDDVRKWLASTFASADQVNIQQDFWADFLTNIEGRS